MTIRFTLKLLIYLAPLIPNQASHVIHFLNYNEGMIITTKGLARLTSDLVNNKISLPATDKSNLESICVASAGDCI